MWLEEDGLGFRYAMEVESERQLYGFGHMSATDTFMMSFLAIRHENDYFRKTQHQQYRLGEKLPLPAHPTLPVFLPYLSKPIIS